MPEASRIGRAIIVTSAALGCVVALSELAETYFWKLNDVVEQTDNEDKGVVTDVTGDLALVVSEDTLETSSKTEPAPPSDATDDLEAQLSAFLQVALQNAGCSGAQISALKAGLAVTSPEASTSGFRGVYLTGSLVVSLDQVLESHQLVGTGKGPFAEDQAIAMAVENFRDALDSQSNLVERCQGD